LLDAAWQLFQERPYQAISVQDVAVHAGLSM
jgi:AcrR family transcriptional regulator